MNGTIITTTCSNCGKAAELGRPIPVQDEAGTAFEIAICDSEDCLTNCIPTHPTDFITLALSGQRITRRYGPCDVCELEYRVDELIAGKTEGYDTPWYCVFCYARVQHNDTATKVLLQILKGNKTMAMITRDGVTTIESVLTSIDTDITDDEQHEFVVWNNGSLSIDTLVGSEFENDRVRLDMTGLRQLRDFLNSKKVSEILAKA